MNNQRVREIIKIKRSGKFRVILVVCRYSKIPGVDFSKSFALVINDFRFQIMMIAKLIWDLEASIIDVETTFLHGVILEKIYMNIPVCMSYD
jgi:hypothetical protein